VTRRSGIVWFACWLVFGWAHAGTLDDIRNRGVIRIATTLDYRPFSFRDGSTRAGIDIDLANHLARTLDVDIEWVDTTWPRLLADLEGDRFDIAMGGISITPARSAHGLFTEAYFRTGKSVLTRCALRQRFHTVADIDRADVTIIVNPGGTNEAFVRRHFNNARILTFPDNLGIFEALARGDADLMITDAVEADIESARHPSLCHDLRPPYLEAIEKAWLLPKDSEWKAWLDRWLETLRHDGSLQAIIAQHIASADPVLQ